MPNTNYDAEHWRKRAEEARAQAEQMSTPGAKRQLLEIAASYEQLVKLAEEGSANKKPRPA
jgi:ADP-heptose:LPS heptosyltransferase